MADQAARYCFPKYKVYIFGVEVTDDTVAINVEQHDGGAPNTCQITLLNEFDKYVITSDDMVGFSSNPDMVLDLPWLRGEQITSQSVSQQSTGGLNEIGIKNVKSQRKQAILEAKHRVEQNFSKSDRKDGLGNSLDNSDFANYYGNKVTRYPIADGNPIFSSMDPVRIAMRDPFNPNRWYWHFTGFVSDIVDNTNENNVKTLTVVVEDPTKLFRYTRIFLNPGIIDAKSAIATEDIRVQSFYANFMRGLSLPEIFFTLFFGPDRAGTEKVLQKAFSGSGQSRLSTKLRGIGHFALDSSSYFTFGPEPSVPIRSEGEKTPTTFIDKKPPIQLDRMKTWQTLLDHEVQPSDLFTMATEDDRNAEASSGTITKTVESLTKDSDGKFNVEAVINWIGTHPQSYLVDGGRLMMLIPRSLGSNNSAVTMSDILQSYALNSEWQSAGAIMMEVIDRIQFVMYCTPRGDVVIEPPLFDFDPDDFGMEAINGDGFIDKIPPKYIPNGDTSNAVSILGRGDIKFPGRDRGPYGPNFIILKRDTYGWEAASVDEKVYTMATCSKAILPGYDNAPNTGIVGDVEVIFLPDLIPLYGVRCIPITPRGFMISREAANLFATITLTKTNADAHTYNVRHIPNIKMWLNRPVYIEGRNCIGTTKRISHSITWGTNGDMSTTSDLYAVRTWSGQVSVTHPSQPIYTTIGGIGSNPLNYAVMFKVADVPKQDTTIVSNTNQLAGAEPSLQISQGLNDALDKVKLAAPTIPLSSLGKRSK